MKTAHKTRMVQNSTHNLLEMGKVQLIKNRTSQKLFRFANDKQKCDGLFGVDNFVNR